VFFQSLESVLEDGRIGAVADAIQQFLQIGGFFPADPQQVRSRIEIKGRTSPPRLSGGQYRCSSHEKSSGRVSELLVRSASLVFVGCPWSGHCCARSSHAQLQWRRRPPVGGANKNENDMPRSSIQARLLRAASLVTRKLPTG